MTITQQPAAFPLPARIFHAAMQRRVSLDAYAATLAIPGDTLRAMLTAQADQLPPEVVTSLAAAHGQRADTSLAPPIAGADVEPFSAWLERQMEGVPQASLRTRAQLEPRLLRAFLSGKSLPDADQAERLARALYVDSAEMARIIVADMIRRTELPQAVAVQGGDATGTGASGARASATRGSARPDAPAPAKVRRRGRLQDAPASAATAPAEGAEPTPPPTPMTPAPSGTGHVDAAPPPGDAKLAAPVSERRRRTARPPAAPAAEVTPIPQILPAHKPPSAAEEAPPPQAAATLDVATAPLPVTSRRKGRAAEAAVPSPAIAQDPSGGEETLATLSEARPPRRTARARTATPGTPEVVRVAADSHPGPDVNAETYATASAAPAQEGDDRPDTDIAGTSSRAITQPPAEAPMKATDRAASPPTVATIKSPTTELELSPDEVRLISSYRRLHPHGRRATLQYIGSLLIEE